MADATTTTKSSITMEKLEKARWADSDTPEQNEKRKKAERHVTDELANQAKQDPGSPEEAESKERRAQAETEFRDTK